MLKQIRGLTQLSSFNAFKAKSTKVAEAFASSKAEVYSLNRIIQRAGESISQIEFRSILKFSAAMPFSFIEDYIKNTDGYKDWMQPLTKQADQNDDTKARLITSLGTNSDLIELNLETASMMFFRQTHALRMIRSIFPLPDSDNESQEANANIDEDDEDEVVRSDEEEQNSVIGFKLAKKTKEVQSVQIYLTQIVPPETADLDDDENSDNLFQLYMLLESALPRYSNVFNQRKSLA